MSTVVRDRRCPERYIHVNAPLQRLTRLLGLSKAKDLIFTGRVLTADAAYKTGE
jgi:enoyl-CoA hydratase/carnithine racemase